MTLAEFNKKWDAVAFDALMNENDITIFKENYRKYLDDCFAMYEHYGFADTFDTIYSEQKENNDMKFKVLRRATIEDGFDLESLPCWEIQFENGKKLMAFPEEICTIER